MQPTQQRFSRRDFSRGAIRSVAAGATGLVLSSSVTACDQQEAQKQEPTQEQDKPAGPVEADFERDYDAPGFKPSWRKRQLNRTMVQDFVIFAHSDLDKVKMLYEREPALLNGTMDWGGGDWEDALGGASHMGRVDIVKFLLSKGARPNIFCAAMMGMIGAVKEMLALEPALVFAKGPHGFTLNMHAQIAKELGHEGGAELLAHIQSLNEVELRPLRFLKKNNN